MMNLRVHLFLLVASVQVIGLTAITYTQDLSALKSLEDAWYKVPLNWKGDDACGKWAGITCNNNRVTSIMLASNNLHGELPSDITDLTALEKLDLSYNKFTGSLPLQIGKLKNLKILILVGCGFSGSIPPSLGDLEQLVYLSLKSNNFYNGIPSSLGTLTNLLVLDLANNSLQGTIPVSPGLDMLVRTKHFHLGKNNLSGAIPPQLFSSNMSLIHLLLDNNQLTGSIPSSLGLVKKLEVVQLHGNSLSGPVPENVNNLTSVQRLKLANNQLTGPVPNLTGMDALGYVDMSNNSFDLTDVPPWFSTLQSLTTLIMQNTDIQGHLPESLFSLSLLQTVDLKNNHINGTLDLGPNYSSDLRLIDLQNNSISAFTERPEYAAQNIILVDNPTCKEPNVEMNYCKISQASDSPYSTPLKNCKKPPCRSNEVASPTCKCAHPYSGKLYFIARLFSGYGNKSLFESLEQRLMDLFSYQGQHVDSISLSNPTIGSEDYLELYLQVFPYGQDYFNRTGISEVGFVLSYQTNSTPSEFGPYSFMADKYLYFEAPHKSGLSTGVAVGGSVLVLLLILAGIYGFHQKRRAAKATKKNDPFASWDSNSNSAGVPQLKGVRSFSFLELKKCTNNFSADNHIGSGGYGKVYRGILPNGQLVAVKRAQQGSMQGDLEFKTEIELLSRVHHKNVVSLVGFCFDRGEQMLIYEYIPNGTLKDSLSGKTGIRLDWLKRLHIALGAARGVQYLHDLANPPIIHRDIKSNNVLLDERLNAKVADFGLSKLVGDSDMSGHVVTQVKGTMGYVDPEYCMTQQLTEKSDVFSFGVLLLELLTARNPIVKGNYIVKEVKKAKDPSKDMYNLQTLMDPILTYNTAPGTVERFVDLALSCVKQAGVKRPPMREVVKEIESIMEFAVLNPNIGSTTSTSNSYEAAAKEVLQTNSNESLFSNSGFYHSSSVEPQ